VSVASPAGLALLGLLRDSDRGPRREGLLALWLVLRIAEDLAEGDLPERGHRRRVTALERRLTSLTLAPPVRRGLQAALGEFKRAAPDAAPLALLSLVAPARDGIGADAAETLTRAARRVAATLQHRYR
jgi:hypothetical protein